MSEKISDPFYTPRKPLAPYVKRRIAGVIVALSVVTLIGAGFTYSAIETRNDREQVDNLRTRGETLDEWARQEYADNLRENGWRR